MELWKLIETEMDEYFITQDTQMNTHRDIFMKVSFFLFFLLLIWKY